MRPQLKALLLGLTCLIAPSLVSQAASVSGCTVEKGSYHCDRDGWLAELRNAKDIAVESKPFDTATTNSLAKLVRTLKKREVSSSPDLTFVLIRSQFEGVFYGPSDRELASFLVYSGKSHGSDGKLIWIVTFNGEPDLVWPIAVFNIIKQFKTSIE